MTPEEILDIADELAQLDTAAERIETAREMMMGKQLEYYIAALIYAELEVAGVLNE